MATVTLPKADEIRSNLEEEYADEINEIGTRVLTEGVTLATLIRDGSAVTTQERGWGAGERACALSAAALAAKARGIIK